MYQEGAGTNGFLNLFWSRVQDPEGTTNMDFEFNKNRCPGTGCSANGVTPIRTTGDILVIYDLSNGGTNPTLSIRRWTASGVWGAPTDLTAANDATGSINTSAIPAAESDGLGAQDPARSVKRSSTWPGSSGEHRLHVVRLRVPEEPVVGLVPRGTEGLRPSGRDLHHELWVGGDHQGR